MRKPGTDPDNVSMSDVLCDFCHREWAEEVPMVEGHHGSCICGRCVSVAYAQLVQHEGISEDAEYTCPLCLDGPEDRAALGRGDEPGWRSPVEEEAVACWRCVKMAAKTLGRDPESDWTVPGTA